MGKTNPQALLKRMAKTGLHPCEAKTTHKTPCRIRLKKAERCKYHKGQSRMTTHGHHATYKEEMKMTRGLEKLAGARVKKGLPVGSHYKPKSS